MFCERCGNKIQDGERFCSVCGNRVEQPKSPEKSSDSMEGMGYGYRQPYSFEQNRRSQQPDERQVVRDYREPMKKRPKQVEEDDDFDEEWREEAKKEKITFIILGIIIVALVISIVVGVIFLIKSQNAQEEKRVPQLTEEQKEELTHSRKDTTGNEASAEENPTVTPEPEVTVPAEQAEEASGAPEEAVGRIAVEETPAPTQEAAPVPTQEAAPIPTQEPVVVEEDDEFMIPDSSTRYLTNADLTPLTEWEIRVARNEIYARHGRIFTSKDLAGYFKAKDWYIGSIAPEAFDDSYLSAIEIENIKFIINYEKAHNLNQ